MIAELRETQHRKFYLKVASVLERLKVSPNTWTLVGFTFGAGMALFIYLKMYLIALIFGLLMALCDIMDGEIAKKNNTTTPFGKLLDVTTDKYVEGMIGLASGLSMPQVLLPSLVWGVLSVWGSIVISLVSNVGSSLTTRKVFKLVGRGDRGLIIAAGLILGGLVSPVFFTYSMILITVSSHITALSMLIQYYFILRKDDGSPRS